MGGRAKEKPVRAPPRLGRQVLRRCDLLLLEHAVSSLGEVLGRGFHNAMEVFADYLVADAELLFAGRASDPEVVSVHSS